MMVAVILFNSVVLTKGAQFMIMDISNFYLNTPLKRPEYLCMKMSDIPPEIVQEYNLEDIATEDGYVYVEATKGMYGLPQSGLLANKLLEKRLNKHGYFQSKFVPGLWTHKWRPITFTLVVDDFGVKYVGKEHAEHLREVIKKYYPVTEEWTGKRYIGITLDWDYVKRQVHLSIPGYVKKGIMQFGHEKPARRQDSPFPHTPPNYGAKKQTPKLGHAIKSPRHLKETGRRKTTLVEAGQQATNVIRTNIKSQRHLEQAGRVRRMLARVDDLDKLSEDLSVSNRIRQKAANSFESFYYSGME